jgi:hypothetical protein
MMAIIAAVILAIVQLAMSVRKHDVNPPVRNKIVIPPAR